MKIEIQWQQKIHITLGILSNYLLRFSLNEKKMYLFMKISNTSKGGMWACEKRADFKHFNCLRINAWKSYMVEIYNQKLVTARACGGSRPGNTSDDADSTVFIRQSQAKVQIMGHENVYRSRRVIHTEHFDFWMLEAALWIPTKKEVTCQHIDQQIHDLCYSLD